jgi:hypothetical protein
MTAVERRDADRSRSPRVRCGVVLGLPDIPDVFSGKTRKLRSHHCGRRHKSLLASDVSSISDCAQNVVRFLVFLRAPIVALVYR